MLALKLRVRVKVTRATVAVAVISESKCFAEEMLQRIKPSRPSINSIISLTTSIMKQDLCPKVINIKDILNIRCAEGLPGFLLGGGPDSSWAAYPSLYRALPIFSIQVRNHRSICFPLGNRFTLVIKVIESLVAFHNTTIQENWLHKSIVDTFQKMRGETGRRVS